MFLIIHVTHNLDIIHLHLRLSIGNNLLWTFDDNSKCQNLVHASHAKISGYVHASMDGKAVTQSIHEFDNAIKMIVKIV